MTGSGARPEPTNAFERFPKDEIEQSIPARFETQVRRHGDRLAIGTDDGGLTYAQLNARANRIARALTKHERDGPVAVLLDHDATALAAIIGTLKAGRTYVPLDPTYPRERVQFILDDAEADILLTNAGHRDVAGGLAPAGCHLLNVEDAAETGCDTDLDLVVAPETLAYIIYTSGSTGRPKGFVETHRNVLHMIMRLTNVLHAGPGDRQTLLRSVSVIGAVRDVFVALLNGAAVFPFDLRNEGSARLGRWLADNEITICTAVATVFRHFVGELGAGVSFPRLRVLHIGGETISRRDVDLYRRHFADECLLLNSIGSTEVGTFRHYFVNKTMPIEGSVLPVGYPLEDTDVLLLDPDGNAVAAGEVGEIAVRSHYLSPGYWRRPELTRESFTTAPDGAQIYRTGDLGRMATDGCLVHLGRADFQVKIRGFRVEVSEIEMALIDGGLVKDALVVAHEVGKGDKRLVAYVVPAEGPAPTAGALRAALIKTLPDFMIPSAFIPLESLPQLPTGKVDRRALPPPESVRPLMASAYELPRTPVEEILATIWELVLRLPQVGIHDDFFELGGNSLSATQIISRVRDAFGVELSLRALFDAPTIAGMTSSLGEIRLPDEGRP